MMPAYLSVLLITLAVHALISTPIHMVPEIDPEGCFARVNVVWIPIAGLFAITTGCDVQDRIDRFLLLTPAAWGFLAAYLVFKTFAGTHRVIALRCLIQAGVTCAGYGWLGARIVGRI